MVEAAPQPSTWTEHGLKRLQVVFDQAKDQSKYLMIWDKQGSVATFCKYKAVLAELAPEIVKASIGSQTNEGIAEFMRAKFVYSMRNGE